MEINNGVQVWGSFYQKGEFMILVLLYTCKVLVGRAKAMPLIIYHYSKHSKEANAKGSLKISKDFNFLRFVH